MSEFKDIRQTTTVDSLYWFDSSLLPNETISKWKNDYTATYAPSPFVPNWTSIQPSKVPHWAMKSADKPHIMGIPRIEGLKKFGEPSTWNVCAGSLLGETPFLKQMRDYQQTAVQVAVIPEWTKRRGGLLVFDVGLGKTITALYAIWKFGRKTLVVVPSRDLVTQWHDRIRETMPQLEVALLYAEKRLPQKYDIIVTTVQSLSIVDKYTVDTFREIGVVIFDEVHHIGAEVFSNAVKNVAHIQCLLGLSATPKRRDGQDKIFEWYLGPILCERHRDSKTKQLVHIHMLSYRPTSLIEIPQKRDGSPNTSRMLSELVQNDERNDFIIDHLWKDIYKEPERDWVIFSHRKATLAHLHELFLKRVRAGYVAYISEEIADNPHLLIPPAFRHLFYCSNDKNKENNAEETKCKSSQFWSSFWSMFSYEQLSTVARWSASSELLERLQDQFGKALEAALCTGDLSKKKREEAKLKPIVFATIELCGEGTDSHWNSGMILDPVGGKAVEQLTGRGIRKDNYDNDPFPPRWIHVWDRWSVFESYGYSCFHSYRKLGYTVKID